MRYTRIGKWVAASTGAEGHQASQDGPLDPESFSRFTRWLNERVRLGGAHAYRLRDAHQLQRDYFSNGEIKPKGEHELRPLKWLTKHDLADRIPEVWAEACRLAGDASPDGPTVRRALAQWKRDNLPKSETKSGGTKGGTALIDRWIADAHRIMLEFPDRFAPALDKVMAEAEELLEEVEA